MSKPRPDQHTRHCEVCGCVLPVDEAGRLRYRSIMVRWGAGVPRSLRTCQPCHRAWLHLARTGEQLTFITA